MMIGYWTEIIPKSLGYYTGSTDKKNGEKIFDQILLG